MKILTIFFEEGKESRKGGKEGSKEDGIVSFNFTIPTLKIISKIILVMTRFDLRMKIFVSHDRMF